MGTWCPIDASIHSSATPSFYRDDALTSEALIHRRVKIEQANADKSDQLLKLFAQFARGVGRGHGLCPMESSTGLYCFPSLRPVSRDSRHRERWMEHERRRFRNGANGLERAIR